ncbi:MAG: hypothetical protein WDW36_008986 [Sanguina aurantia]
MPPKKAAAKCLYDVLELTGDCEDDAVKKAYRRMALQWHPDKNQHRIEEAQDRFKEIQNAYEILSDRQERAWYDSHREQILKSGDRHQAGGGSGGYEKAGFDPPDDEEELFEYFSSGCYTGYGDGSKGFYAVYATLFAKLAKQEAEAWEKRGAAGDEDGEGRQPPVHPGFGMGCAVAAEVNAFYGYWSTFATAKDFSWADSYNLAAAPSRPVRRRMEEENMKARKSARREFNAKVRDLVAFVKKRDKRVAKFQAEDSARRVVRAAEEEGKKKREKEERMAKAAEYVEADWIRNSHKAAGSGSDSSSDDIDATELYCIVCEKTFKSEKQFHNHERSKKHQEKLSLLKAQLEAEEAEPLSAIQEEDEGSGGDGGCSPGRPTGGGCKGSAAAAAAQPQYFGVHQPSQGQGQGKKKSKKKNGQRLLSPVQCREAERLRRGGGAPSDDSELGAVTVQPLTWLCSLTAAQHRCAMVSLPPLDLPVPSVLPTLGGPKTPAVVATPARPRRRCKKRARTAAAPGGKQQRQGQAPSKPPPAAQPTGDRSGNAKAHSGAGRGHETASAEDSDDAAGDSDDEDAMLARMMASSRKQSSTKAGSGEGQAIASEGSSDMEDAGGDDDEDAMLARMMASSSRGSKQQQQRRQSGDGAKSQPGKQGSSQSGSEEEEQDSDGGDEDADGEDAMLARMMASSASLAQGSRRGDTSRQQRAAPAAAGAEAGSSGGEGSDQEGSDQEAGAEAGSGQVEPREAGPSVGSDTGDGRPSVVAQDTGTGTDRAGGGVGCLPPAAAPAVAGPDPAAARPQSTARAVPVSSAASSSVAGGARSHGAKATRGVVAKGDGGGSGGDSSEEGGRKGSKRKQKAAARRAQASAADAVVAGRAATACGVCGVECGTRNRLFSHIKESGHAVLKA